MTIIVVLFNLKPGVSAAEYEAWAKATDLPTVNSLTYLLSLSLPRFTFAAF